MLSKTRSSTPVYSPAPGVIPDTMTGPASDGSSVATNREPAAVHPAGATDRETHREHSRRKAVIRSEAWTR